MRRLSAGSTTWELLSNILCMFVACPKWDNRTRRRSIEEDTYETELELDLFIVQDSMLLYG